MNQRFQIMRLLSGGAIGFLISWAVFPAPLSARAGPTNEILTTAADVLSLTSDQAARSIQVSLSGVVTFVEADWGGRFFVQDFSSGVFVNSTKQPAPSPGDVVQVDGVSDPGSYSPVITSASWKKLGTGTLPQARPVSIERFMSGAEDGQRVEVSGMAKSAQTGETRIALELESGRYSFHAFAPISLESHLNLVVGAKVHIRGTAAVAAESKRGSKPNVYLFVPLDSDLIVDQPTAKVVASEPMRTVAELLALTTDQAANGVHLSITGVVTAAEFDWGGDFYVQDLTGGVLVKNTQEPPVPGDILEVSGVSHVGGYAMGIGAPHWKKLGTAPLPEAKPISVERLVSGAEDGRRVEVSGVVRSAQPSELVSSRLAVELASGGDHFWAFPPRSIIDDPNSLVGAMVRLRGTAAASFVQPLRGILTIKMFVPRVSDFIIEESPATTVSQQPFISLKDIAQYRQNGSSEPRIKVKGTVTYQRPGEDIFLRDETGSLRVKCGDTNAIAIGEIVEAIGFVAWERFLPVLQDAALIRTRKFEKPIVPQKVAVRELLEGFHDAELISLQGKLLDYSLRAARAAHSPSLAPADNILTLQNGAYFFSVRAPATGPFAKLASVPIGSTLEVAGICLLQPDERGKMESAQVLLPEAANVRILQRPSWWTAERLLIGFGLVMAVAVTGAAWSLMILRKNAALEWSIAEKHKAQEELQEAHDLLEWRVHERTKELTFETSARKEAEVRVEAIVAERTRIAQDLHDTLLQGFTGIGLKLQALASTLPESLSTTKDQLEKILQQSDEYMTEARRTVWTLRSPSLEKHDFPTALMRVSERALEGTGIRFNFSVDGTARKTDLETESNLLRICEEAVANAAKHAHPTEVEVNLRYAPKELQLRIRDNGCGFKPNGRDGVKAGHFGLVGIRGRTKSLAGKVGFNSSPGRGTEIIVRLPCLEPCLASFP